VAFPGTGGGRQFVRLDWRDRGNIKNGRKGSACGGDLGRNRPGIDWKQRSKVGGGVGTTAKAKTSFAILRVPGPSVAEGKKSKPLLEKWKPSHRGGISFETPTLQKTKEVVGGLQKASNLLKTATVFRRPRHSIGKAYS